MRQVTEEPLGAEIVLRACCKVKADEFDDALRDLGYNPDELCAYYVKPDPTGRSDPMYAGYTFIFNDNPKPSG